ARIARWIEHIVRRSERNQSSRRILSPAQGAVEPKGDRCVSEKFHFGLIKADFLSFFGAARDEANGADGRCSGILQTNEIRAGEATANQNAASRCAHVGIIGGAYGNGEIEIVIFKQQGPAAEPMFHHIANTFAKNLRNEKAAIEEDGVDAMLG